MINKSWLCAHSDYLELSELEEEESLRLRAGLRDLRRGDDRGERPLRPAGDRDRRPDRDLLLRPLEGDRLRGGERRRGEGDLRPRGDRDLPPSRLLGGDLPPLGGVLDLLLGGLRDLCLRGGLLRRGWIRGMSTGAAVTSWPSIWPPSMCLSAFLASSEFSYSM